VSVFGSYARYYDLLYRDKDYAAEAADALRRIHGQSPQARRILELGCGTGLHAIELARRGCDVTGIDISEPMLESARQRLALLDGELKARLRFQRMDARSCRLEGPFDAVTALFHVVSYQTSDADLAGLFSSAAAHLRPGSPFLFDFWYGPAVLAQRPEVRVKRFEDETVEVLRLAEPTLRDNDDCVDVRYSIWIGDKREGQGEGRRFDMFSENHSMRYFFLPALESALAGAGLELVAATGMDSDQPPSPATWSAFAVARKL
jgi:SAM-dependent methyltransferase